MLTESTNKLTYEKLSKEEMESRGILGRLVGVCADFISPTRNGRKYPEQLWENIFNSDLMKERIANGVCFGELGHPVDREETDMEKVCICLPEEPKKGPDGKLRAVFDILDTPNGRILKSLCDYGSTLGISSRGSGDLEVDFNGQESVNPDTYNCEGFDIVLLPGVKEARLQYVTESLDKKRYNKTLRQKLQESIEKESEENQKVIKEALNDLGIELNEKVSAKYKGYTILPSEDGSVFNIYTDDTKDFELSSDWKDLASAKMEIDKEINTWGEDEAFGGALRLDEALSPEEKMDAWHDGTRSQNIKACSDEKLWKYKRICDSKGYTAESQIIEDEMVKRGMLQSSQAIQAKNEKDIPEFKYDKENDELLVSYTPAGKEFLEQFVSIKDLVITDLINEPLGDGTYYTISARMPEAEKIAAAAIKLIKNNSLQEQICEAYFGGFKYKYSVNAHPKGGNNVLLGGSRTLDDAIDIGIRQAQEVFETSFMTSKEKFDYLETMYISDDENGEILDTTEFDDYVDGLMSELSAKSDFNESMDNSKLNTTEYHMLDKAYNNKLQFNSIDDGKLKDIINYLTTHNQSYDIYEHKTDNGCTLFYEGTIDILEKVQLADDNDMAIVNELQEALKLNRKLDEKIVELQNKLSASNAKEMKLEESIDNYKYKIAKLSNHSKENLALREKISKLEENLKQSSEEVKLKKTTLHETMQRDAKERQNLKEQLSNKEKEINNLNDRLLSAKSEISKSVENVNNLIEQLEIAKKDTKQLKEKYSQKLEDTQKLVEKYKKVAKVAVDNYIDKQATLLGTTSTEIKNKLPEKYTFKDIDTICESLREYKVNMNSLPFDTTLNENINISAKNINNKTLINANIDDEISDADIKLAEKFMK